MDLKSPANLLWPLVEKMGGEKADFILNRSQQQTFELPEEVRKLNTEGKEILLDDVVVRGGLLSTDGAQIVLYIPDHSFRFDQAVATPGKGNKVHVADCQTLETMRQKNRFQRYRAIVNTTGEFSVFGVSSTSGEQVEGKATLFVCRFCLQHLNYKGYSMGGRGQRDEIVKTFSLEEFFGTYSTLFKYLPAAFSAKEGGYVSGWQEISDRFRESIEWKCENCQLNLRAHKRLLHVHHQNGDKSDNSVNNLKALCADCHRKQPMHNHMFINIKDMSTIQRLRREQGLLSQSDGWAKLVGLVDSSFEGLLRRYEGQKRTRPEIGYDVLDSNGEVVAQAELAWPLHQKAVVHSEDEKALLTALGWTVRTLSEALDDLR